MNQQLLKLYDAMLCYEQGVPGRIQHLMKVRDFADIIGVSEGMDDRQLFILNTACLVHDIGIKEALKQYGKCTGKMQEELGPDIAQEMLSGLGFEDEVINRVCYLVGHHHTYTNVDGLDYQILLEADALVNLYENKADKDVIKEWYCNIFKTETGKHLCLTMFDIKED